MKNNATAEVIALSNVTMSRNGSRLGLFSWMFCVTVLGYDVLNVTDEQHRSGPA